MGWMDYHLHTRDSADSDASMDAVCRRAVALRLDEICFTEHYDVDPYDPGYGYYDDARYERRLAAARRRWAGRLEIRKGLEFDFQSRHAGRLAARLAPWRFDFLIGSVHNVFGGVPPRALDRGFPPDEVYREYFAELRALVDTGLADVLGHVDYVWKLCAGRLPEGYRYEPYEAEAADLARQMVARGVGLEVNTRHCARADRPQPIVPGLAMLRAYHAAGGRCVVLGSDAHAAGQVAVGFPEACRLLRRSGFAEVCSFAGRRAELHPLPDCDEGLAGLRAAE